MKCFLVTYFLDKVDTSFGSHQCSYQLGMKHIYKKKIDTVVIYKQSN